MTTTPHEPRRREGPLEELRRLRRTIVARDETIARLKKEVHDQDGQIRRLSIRATKLRELQAELADQDAQIVRLSQRLGR